MASGRLKSEFIVDAGADPTLIRMEYSGVASVSLSEKGELVVSQVIGLFERNPETPKKKKAQE